MVPLTGDDRWLGLVFVSLTRNKKAYTEQLSPKTVTINCLQLVFFVFYAPIPSIDCCQSTFDQFSKRPQNKESLKPFSPSHYKANIFRRINPPSRQDVYDTKSCPICYFQFSTVGHFPTTRKPKALTAPTFGSRRVRNRNAQNEIQFLGLP